MTGACWPDTQGIATMGYTFGTQATYAAGLSPRSVTAADVNGDGRLDLVTANFASGTVSVLLGTATGFAA